MRKESFDIQGMTCSACSARVEKSAAALPGVHDVSVNLLQNTMTLRLDEALTSARDVIVAIERAGYGASLKNQKTPPAKATNHKDASLKKRVVLSALFELPLFYLAMGHMMGWPLPGIFSGAENALIFAFTQFLLLLPILILNRSYFADGFRSLLHGAPNMSSLVAIGSGAAAVYGIYAIYRISFALGHGDAATAHLFMMNLYFESAGMILTLITLGKMLEARAKRRTSDAISKLMDLAPKTATVVREGTELTVAVEELRVGDVLIVKAGESVPADGTVISGSATVDESALTGESIPAEKAPGDSVIGATVSRSGYFTMKADKVGEDTALSKILHLVEEATSSKAPIAKLADKISGVFVPIVISLALLSTIIWLIAGLGAEFALSIGISVLVISCPCALGLATPTAITVGMGRGASSGILIKSAEALQTLHAVNTVVLDKTGTLTSGVPQVTDIHTANNTDPALLLRAAHSLERLSEHPLARAIADYATARSIPSEDIKDFRQVPGGIAGTLNGKNALAGNRRLMEQHGIDTTALPVADELAAHGKTPLYFALDGALLGMITVADTLKPSSKQAVSELNEMGLEVIMLTGDNEKTAHAIAAQAGIAHTVCEVYPADKEQEIRRLQALGKRVAMVGDGINDAPALARADVGLAIGAGTDIAMESADVVLMKSDLADVPRAIRLSRAVMRNIKQNLFWAFFYNVIGIPVAAGALYLPLALTLDPMIAGAAMSMSSVFVVTNALRLRAIRLTKKEKNHTETTEKGEKTMQKTIGIEGMSCPHCVMHAQKALAKIEGVIEATVDLAAKSATVKTDKEIDDAVFKAAIEDAGYTVTKIC